MDFCSLRNAFYPSVPPTQKVLVRPLIGECEFFPFVAFCVPWKGGKTTACVKLLFVSFPTEKKKLAFWVHSFSHTCTRASCRKLWALPIKDLLSLVFPVKFILEFCLQTILQWYSHKTWKPCRGKHNLMGYLGGKGAITSGVKGSHYPHPSPRVFR